MTNPVTAGILVQRPFDADALVAFLAARAVAGVEHVEGRTYARSLRLTHGPGIVSLQFDADEAPAPSQAAAAAIAVTLQLTDQSDEAEALHQCRHLVGAAAPAAQIHRVLTQDRALNAIVAATPGMRVPGAVDGPEILIRALLGQQVSVAAARNALGKLTKRTDERLPAALTHSAVPGAAPLTHLFPSPAAIASLAQTDIGCPRARAAAIIDAAADMASGALDVRSDRPVTDLTADLVSRRGIGPWTAGYTCLRVLADPDILLVGDLALRRGAAALGLPGDSSYLKARGERWRPYRSYAGMYLWRAAAL